MTPLYEKFARGGWLFGKKGSVYSNGKSPFYGSFGALLELDEQVLCASMKGKNSYTILTDKGNLLSAGESRSTIPVFGSSFNVMERFSIGAISGDNIALYDGESTIYTKKISLIEKQNFDGEAHTVNLERSQTVKELTFSSSGNGLYVLINDGTIISFGDAETYGDFISEDISANAISMSLKPWGEGYWVIDDIGGVFCFGDADYFGSIPGDGMRIDAVKIKAHSSGRGYWIVDAEGRIFPFGYAEIMIGEPNLGSTNICDFVPEEILNSKSSLKGAKGITSFLFEHIKKNNESDEEIEIL